MKPKENKRVVQKCKGEGEREREGTLRKVRALFLFVMWAVATLVLGGSCQHNATLETCTQWNGAVSLVVYPLLMGALWSFCCERN